ncbi:MAG: hypothetical protein ABIH04_07310 [Planctomycetota bacterium]
MITMILALLVIFAFGYAVLILLGLSRAGVSLVERFALSYGLGTFGLAFVLLFISLAGVPLERPWILWLSAAPLPVLGIHIVRRLRRGRVRRQPDGSPRPSGAAKALIVFCLAFAVLMVAATYLDTVHFALRGDAAHFWGLKAKILYFKSFQSDDYITDSQAHQHVNYPLLVPLLEAWSFRWMAWPRDVEVKLLFPTFFAALLAGLYAALKKISSGTWAAIAVFLLAGFGPFIGSDNMHLGSATSGYADVPLAFYYAMAVFYLVRWSRRDGERTHGLLGAIFLAACMFTKNEGSAISVLAVILLSVIVITSRRFAPRESRWREWALIVTVFAVLALPWLMVRGMLPANDENYPSRLTADNFVEGINRNFKPALLKMAAAMLPISIDGNKIWMSMPRLWDLFWPALLVICVVYARRCLSPQNRFVAALVILHLLLYLAILTLAPGKMWNIEHLMIFVRYRLLSHIAPVALLLFVMLVDFRDAKARGEPGAQPG